MHGMETFCTGKEDKKEFESKPGPLKMFKRLQTSGLKRFSRSIFCGPQDWKVKQAEIETTVHYNHVTAINSNGFLSLFHFNIMDCCRLSCDTQPCDLNNEIQETSVLTVTAMSSFLKPRIHNRGSTYFSILFSFFQCLFFQTISLLPRACPALQTSTSRLPMPLPNPERQWIEQNYQFTVTQENLIFVLLHSFSFTMFPQHVERCSSKGISPSTFYQHIVSMEYIKLLLGACK